ncbi:hypothetical protein BH10CHL1_BH10CHL1_33950 [soil metagenome]
MAIVANASDEQTKPKPQQLRMVWPEQLLNTPPEIRLHEGYTLRTYQPGDEPGFYHVMDLAGFTGWDMEKLAPTLATILPDGWFLIVDQTSGEIVATTMATHHPSEFHPFGGEMGWVAGHPAHAGKGLGKAVCAAVTRRFLSAGYKNIYLRTDDWRLPAIKTYLTLGYQPFLFAPDMMERWAAICGHLAWKFTPELWPKAE